MKVISINPYTTTRNRNTEFVSFKAMKPSMFGGLNYACVRKFKAPVEKFNTVPDFQNWAQEKLHTLLERDWRGRTDATLIQREAIIKEWNQYLSQNKNVTPAISLIILTSILKELKSNNDTIPPTLNKKALDNSITDLNTILEDDKDSLFDFSKIYQKNINKLYYSSHSEYTKPLWVVIPSLAHDKENFSSNIEKLKYLSAESWCTKSLNAESYLAKGDFHIYIEQGKPKLCLRFNKDTLIEIQNQKNNNLISLKFLDILNNYINIMKFKLSNSISERIKEAKKKRELVKNIQNAMGLNEINKERPFIITNYLGFEPKIKHDGTLSLGKYEKPEKIPENISIEDLGIDENKLFENISEIRTFAKFSETGVTNLGKLKRIGDYADFEESVVMSLGELEEIGGYANFANSIVNSTGKLKRIGKWADFENSILEVLKNIEYIGGNAYFNNSRIQTLGALKYIGGSADFSDSEVLSTGQLEFVGKHIIINHSKLTAEDIKNINKPRN